MRAKQTFLSDEDLVKCKVEVEADDPLSYQEICSIVDSPLILMQIVEHRRIFNITPPSKEEYPDYQLFLHMSGLDNYSKFIDIGQDTCIDQGFPVYYASAIAQAILFGHVRWNQVQVMNTGPVLGHFEGLQVLVIGPRARNKDVKRALEEVRQNYKSNSFRFNTPMKIMKKRSEFDKTREWYWQHLAGKSYQEIADEWSDTHPEKVAISKEVNDAILIYKKSLIGFS